MATGLLTGGLQSALNPGKNIAPGATAIRKSTAGIAQIPRGPRPAAPPPMPGRLKPIAPPNRVTPLVPIRPVVAPPVGVAGALPAGPAASLLQFDQWLATQPLWIQQQAADVDQQNSLMAGYGFYKDATGHLVADPKAAQDSVIAQEDLHRQQGIGHTAQAGSNHGNLFSGASLLGVQNADDAYRVGAAKALRDLTEKTGAITQHELDTKVGLAPGYTDAVGATKIASPESVLAGFAANKNPANAMAGIDQYLKAYGKFLTPAQMTAFAHARAIQANIQAHTAPPRPVVAKKKTPPAKKPAKQRAGAGAYAGNQGGGSAARGA